MYRGYQIPSTTLALLYTGVVRATSAKLHPDPFASCRLVMGKQLHPVFNLKYRDWLFDIFLLHEQRKKVLLSLCSHYSE
jgi:hypothetical protein